MTYASPSQVYKINNTCYKISEHLQFTDKQIMLPNDVLDGLYDLLKTVYEIFNKNNIKVFTIDVTLLSDVCHEAFMH